MYPEIMVIPMREELSRAGIKEARTAEEVDAALAKPGTTMLVVNSICGCAAGKMRPGVRAGPAEQDPARSGDHRVCRTGPRSDGARPLLLRRPSSNFARHRYFARRQAGVPDAALCDRDRHSTHDRPGIDPGHE
jgi:hypothetical protein